MHACTCRLWDGGEGAAKLVGWMVGWGLHVHADKRGVCERKWFTGQYICVRAQPGVLLCFAGVPRSKGMNGMEIFILFFSLIS